jgi:hypothetical protein
MSEATTRCPKCNCEMAQGFIVDFRGGPDKLVSHWVDGPPEKAFGPIRKCLQTSAFQWAPSAVRAADFLSRTHGRNSVPNSVAESNAAPDRAGITVFQSSTSHQPPRQVNGIVSRFGIDTPTRAPVGSFPTKCAIKSSRRRWCETNQESTPFF